MSDLPDGPEHAGNGTNRDTGNRTSVSSEAISPTAPRKPGQASPTEQPKKKRKVNHGSCVSSIATFALTNHHLQHASTAVVR